MTNYNDAQFFYNAPIPYNGVLVPPVPINRGGGGFIPSEWYQPLPNREEEEAVVLILAEMLADE